MNELFGICGALMVLGLPFLFIPGFKMALKSRTAVQTNPKQRHPF